MIKTMKKKNIYRQLFTLFGLLLLLIQIGGCNKYNALFQHNLKGKVKSVEVISYGVWYDEGEVPIKDKDDIEDKVFTTYDKKGNLLSATSNDGYQTNRTTNNKKLIIDEYAYEYEDGVKRKRISYRKMGFPSKTLIYKDEVLIGETTYYSEDRKLFIGITKDINETIEGIEILKFKNKNIIEKSVTRLEKFNKEYISLYDSKTNKVIKYIDTNDKNTIECSFIYDESGLVTKSINGLFDEHIGITLGDGYDHAYNYKYEYDKMNNWIKCTVYQEGEDEPVLFKERTITYY